MKILSLFDGISCARVALERAGIPVEAYYASEIDKYAMQISQKNYPDIIQIGDVKEVKNRWGFMNARPDIDLLIGGSPCQDLSIAKKDRKGLDGERSGLFYEYLRIRDEIKPKYFILENVASMSKEARNTISKELGVEPVMINAALVSAQNRKRYFWVGKLDEFGTYQKVDIPQPEDNGILLKDILLNGDTLVNPKMMSWKEQKEKSNSLTASMGKEPPVVGTSESIFQYRRTYWREIKGDKVPTLTANMGTGGNNVPYVGVPARKLTPVECERLQGLPDNYTEGISNTQRYKCLGNAFNVDVVAHIIKQLK